MIARIIGEVIEHDGAIVVINCSGVGYGVELAVDELSKLPVGSKASLYIAENIKEDSHDLYGFADKTRRQLFGLLTSVNGVGPKAGMAIMNIGPEAQIRSAIASGDTKYITAAKGIGKKVAERVVVDLKNKVGLQASESATDFLGSAPTTDEAVQALVALGYSSELAIERLRGVDTKLSTKERIKQALKG
jgi:holliday junction DNA helicase RuvA